MMDFSYSFTEKWDGVATWKHYIYSLHLCMMSNALLTCNHAKELFLFHELREWDELKMIMVENNFFWLTRNRILPWQGPRSAYSPHKCTQTYESINILHECSI